MQDATLEARGAGAASVAAEVKKEKKMRMDVF